MKKRLLVGLAALVAMPAWAGITFSEYEAATEAAVTRSHFCKNEVRTAGEPRDKCRAFFEYLDHYQELSRQFQSRMASEGVDAFDGASEARQERHIDDQSQLNADINYIGEMMR